tara:strand:- start:110 stop:490 length:381 start_codon:yes stop_codon:yes gene_type:complete
MVSKSPRIDIVPLVDVLMVLIIFFLATMQFQDLRALNVKLPKIESAGSNLMQEEIVVSINQQGEFLLNGKSMSAAKISSLLNSASQLPVKPKILVAADEDTPIKFVTEIVDICRIAGLEDFRLQSR